MPRAAGSKPGYTFVLRNENTGRYMKDVTIWLPSSTTIIKQTLAAPALVGWAYRTTRDNIAGLVDTLALMPDLRAEQIVDMLADADWLDEYLKENQLRPDDVRDEKAEVGSGTHGILEELCRNTRDKAEELATQYLDSAEGSVRAVAGWWLVNQPDVIESEKILPHHREGYCGTTDLVWRPKDTDRVRVTDLKSRRAGLYVYEGDQYQVDSYRLAWNATQEEQAYDGSVLLAFDDGTYKEEPVTLEEGAFLNLKVVYDQVATVRPGRGR